MLTANEPFTVLALDGGGMRGLYSVSVLRTLASRFSACGRDDTLDVGKGFDLIVGTSTGGILAAGLAAGVGLERIRRLYKMAGPRIFQDPVPLNRLRLGYWLCRHLGRAGNDNKPLMEAVRHTFGDETLGRMYSRRGIRLCLTATSFFNHSPRVFKTGHLASRDRDDNMRIVDACLATSAAPIYLPLVSTDPDNLGTELYADGGLWANSPVLVGILEAMAITKPNQPITVISIGTCPPVAGAVPPSDLSAGVFHWLKGVLILNLVMNTQATASRNMAALLIQQLCRLGKEVKIVRCHESSPSAEQSQLLQLDAATPDAMSLMEQLGKTDGLETYRWCQPPETKEGEMLTAVFSRMLVPRDNNRKEKQCETAMTTC